jgi:hypothetical protein
MAWETMITALLALLIGNAFCFGGYKWFMILLPLLGLLIGFILGAEWTASVYGLTLLSVIPVFAAGIIVGLFLAIAAYLFFDFSIILLVATLGYSLGAGILINMSLGTGLVPNIAGWITAGVAALLAMRLHLPKKIIIILTALFGAAAIVNGLLLLMGLISLERFSYGIFDPIAHYSDELALLVVPLAAVGFMIQLKGARNYELDRTGDDAV